MIFGTWRSYFISWQIFENKVWCPVSKKIRRYFHFLLSLAYPIDRLDWALFSVVILFHHWFPLLEKVDIRAFILPRNFPAVLIIFTGRGGAGRDPPSSPRRGFPAGRGVHPWLSDYFPYHIMISWFIYGRYDLFFLKLFQISISLKEMDLAVHHLFLVWCSFFWQKFCGLATL